MNKLKGIVHDFIHVFCIFSFCFSYLCLRAPTPIKAYSTFYITNPDKLRFIAQASLNYTYKELTSNPDKYPDFDIEIYKYFSVSFVNSYNNALSKQRVYPIVHFIPSDIVLSKTDKGDYISYWFDSKINISKYKFYKASLAFDINENDIYFQINPGLYDYLIINYKDTPQEKYYLYGLFNLDDGSRYENYVEEQPSNGFCTFTWFQDYETVDDLLQAIAINPANQGLNPYVIVSSSVQGSSSCEEKGTKNLYNTGSFRIVNGFPEFMYTKPPCKDEQIPTADNVFFYGTEVPEAGQEQYHAVCTYDNKTVYEYKEGSSGGGLVPDEPDYGIFQPLVDLLNSIFAPITALLNLFFGNFSTSLETLFKSLFVPTDTYFSNKWDGFYGKFNQKFPFISDIKPLVDSFTAMATNSSTARPDFTITLPEFVGGQTVQIVDLTWFDEYRSMVHAGILFFIYTTFILRLPRKTASAIGGTTS